MAKSKTTKTGKGKAAKGKAAKGKAANKSAKPMSRTAIVQQVAEKTELNKKKVIEVFDALAELIRREVSAGGAGQFKLPTGLVTVKRVFRKERPAREGRDPRTGEPRTYPAKPAHWVVKAYALKSLRDLAGV